MGFLPPLRSRRSHVMLNIVRKLIKLVLFFTLSFAILFLIATGLRFLVLRVDWIRTLSHEKGSVLFELINAARWALSFVLYSGVLVGLSYAVRKEVFSPVAILCVLALTAGFTYGISQIIENWEGTSSARVPAQPLGKPGVILANTARSTGTAIVLLQGPTEPDGSRVVATPGKPLVYQAEFAGRNLPSASLPPAQFTDNTPWFLKSLSIDLRLNTEILWRYYNEGLLSFLMYTGSLVFFLCSLIFIFKLSAWPLANLCLGCLAFRGVLALEIFFNTPEIQETFDSFLQNRLPLPLVVPLIFCAVGLLAYLYSFLVFIARRQNYAG
jgi:hypothetical protein